jgi:hypothetical protein
MSAKHCYPQKQGDKHPLLVNSTGADLDQGEFAVIAGQAVIADEDVASAASGTFDATEGDEIQTSDLHATENTFGTAQAAVYWDPTSKTFSDTKTAGYYKVGYVKEIKASGIIVFVRQRWAELVPSFAGLVDVDAASPTNNDTLKYVSSTHKWTIVAVAD